MAETNRRKLLHAELQQYIAGAPEEHDQQENQVFPQVHLLVSTYVRSYSIRFPLLTWGGAGPV